MAWSSTSPSEAIGGSKGQPSDLEIAIHYCLAEYNDHPKPFVWHAKAADILAKVRRGKPLLESGQGPSGCRRDLSTAPRLLWTADYHDPWQGRNRERIFSACDDFRPLKTERVAFESSHRLIHLHGALPQ